MRRQHDRPAGRGFRSRKPDENIFDPGEHLALRFEVKPFPDLRRESQAAPDPEDRLADFVMSRRSHGVRPGRDVFQQAEGAFSGKLLCRCIGRDRPLAEPSARIARKCGQTRTEQDRKACQ
jgi:hypothetical protein